ncbi:AmmeMemoRadiSam system protein B [Prevotella sp. kh1p2]|uniref:AmmeMemoRadiSam system protein B n=1 Tax=Prevotella sp. kh1p2 TaxID=1761883 RepID=UPI002101B43B|nr:AmmeMemoRadiSam system protein B [Prevotella sp. kh1p2]
MSSCNTNSKSIPRIRPMAVAGQFYPATAEEALRELRDFEHAAGSGNEQADGNAPALQALIVPHAGWVFSGRVAYAAVAQIPRGAKYEHIFLLGPSHHVGFDGASVNTAFDCYQTPLGHVRVDRELCGRLVDRNGCFTCLDSAHTREHCLEVQLPLLQYRFGGGKADGEAMPPIVPIIIGTQRQAVLQQIAAALKPYFNSRNLFVISSDFSHYPSYDDANAVDRRTGEAIMTGRLADFLKAIDENEALQVPRLATCACGESAIAVLLMLCESNPALRFHHVMYHNSGDSPYGGKREVVGYHAFVVSAASHHEAAQSAFSLTEKDKQTLLELARCSIQKDTTRLAELQSQLAGNRTLHFRTGAFVTLTKGGRLRGCIGHFGSDMPLCEVVTQMAHAAAYEDPRFTPVEAHEYSDIEIEISVLTPLRRIHSIDEFTLHKQGIYMRKGWRSGTFLPQVADEVSWTKEEFLGHCAQDKAGIGWNGWRDAELYTYEAIIFK